MSGARITVLPDNCPTCNAAIRTAFDPELTGAPARPFDFLVCCRCATCLIIGAEGALREPSYRELAIATPATRVAIMTAQSAILARQARHEKAN